MTKKLFLIRHGKSDWADIQLSDFDRPLNARGNRNAPEMAERILKKDLVPQLIVSSPALRALFTARHFAKVWAKPAAQIQLEINIYEASAASLLKVLNSFDDEFDRIALFGHNPGLTDFANYLSDANIYNIPTAGTVLIEFDVDKWSEIGYHDGKLIEFDYPKSIDED